MDGRPVPIRRGAPVAGASVITAVATENLHERRDGTVRPRRLSRRLVSMAAVTWLVLTAVVLLLAAPARAHSVGPPAGQAVICADSSYVYSCFEIDGDDFWVYDKAADGRSAVALWETDYGRSGECRNSHGHSTWHECTYDLREARCVRWRHALYDGDTGAWSGVTAWTSWQPTGSGSGSRYCSATEA